MKENEFLDGMSNIESDVVECFLTMDNRLQIETDKPKINRAWLKLTAAAACFALIISVRIGIPMLRKESSKIPIWDTVQYSAKDISEFFGSTDSAATNAYTEICVPDSKYLYINDLTEKDYLEVYQCGNKKAELSADELQTFGDSFLPKLAKALKVYNPKLNVKEQVAASQTTLKVSAEIEFYSMNIGQNEVMNSFSLSRYRGKTQADREIVIQGETIQIDQRLSDEEIIDSLQSIKNKLFNIFDVDFPDIKIIRRYDSYSEYGVNFIDIYFYDKNAHPLNMSQTVPVSDYISIEFDNFKNYSGDIVSNGLLKYGSVVYKKNRIAVADEYVNVANAKKTSLKEAEDLLYKGYVFGGHICSLCMEAQDKIHFDNYDFVDIEYVFQHKNGTAIKTVGIPFYVFYKNIGTLKNGRTIYAKTYVPAIQISGYDEYFEAQKEGHPNN